MSGQYKYIANGNNTRATQNTPPEVGSFQKSVLNTKYYTARVSKIT